jgi:hypothetical protein
VVLLVPRGTSTQGSASLADQVLSLWSFPNETVEALADVVAALESRVKGYPPGVMHREEAALARLRDALGDTDG